MGSSLGSLTATYCRAVSSAVCSRVLYTLRVIASHSFTTNSHRIGLYTSESMDDPPTEIDPYKTLGLLEAASADEIKTAYRKAALRWHPDKASDKEAAHIKFQEIAFAYAVLSDERRRKRYDSTGRTE